MLLALTVALTWTHGWGPRAANSQEADPTSGVKASPPEPTLTVTPSGVSRNVAGRWSTVGVNGLNKTAEDAEEISIVTVGDDTDLQYARRLWVPAMSRRQSWLPLQISSDIFPDDLQVEMTMMQLTETANGEEFKANEVGMPKGKRSLLMSHDSFRTGILLSPRVQSFEGNYKAGVIRKMLYAASDTRIAGGQDLGMIDLTGGFIPPTSKPLDALDQIVVANDGILADTVGVQRIRTWLNSGGRLWVMVDQMTPESVQKLIGDAACYSIIDKVELNEYQIRVRALHSSSSDGFTEMSFENPIPFARVVVDTNDVVCDIEGWPVAFWKQVGKGEVLFTTLGARGWLINGEMSPALQTVANRFFVTKLEEPRHVAEISQVLNSEIGYTIPSRSSVAWVLTVQMLAVLLGGLWLARIKKLQHLAVLVPVSTLLATATLVSMGKLNTSQVPSTIATGQIVRTTPGSANAGVNSVSAVYSQEQRELAIVSSGNSTTHLVSESVGGAATRIVWDDTGGSRWYFVNQPPGVVRHVETEAVVPLPVPWNAIGKFTPEGFEVRTEGIDAAACEDLVVCAVAAPSLSLGQVDLPSATYRGKELLPPDRFMDDSLLSEVKQMRQELLRELTRPLSNFLTPEPVLMTWTKPVDAGVQFGEGYKHVGWALVSMPVRYERTPSATNFKVPATFVRQGPLLGQVGSMFFNAATGKWLAGLLKPGQAEVRCSVPQSVMPCDLKRVNVDLKMNAPGRTVFIKGFVNGKFKTLRELVSPIERIQFSIEDTEALQLDAEGGLRIAIEVSESDEQIAVAKVAKVAKDAMDDKRVTDTAPIRKTWGIDYLRVGLEGTAK